MKKSILLFLAILTLVLMSNIKSFCYNDDQYYVLVEAISVGQSISKWNKYADEKSYDNDNWTASLDKLDFEGFVVNNANLSYASLSSSDFHWTHLERVNMIGANLNGADLRGANLKRANLSGATLMGADLTGADLTGAYVEGADFGGAKLDPETREYLKKNGALLSNDD